MSRASDEHLDLEDEDEETAVWVTRDKRVVRIRDMDDGHLENTIRFLERRGMRSPEELSADLVAATEFQIGGLSEYLQKKYAFLIAERKSRAEVSAADNVGP